MHSFYTVIILKEFKGVYKIVDDTLLCSIDYSRDNFRGKVTDQLIAVYLLDILEEQQDKLTIELIIDHYMKEIVSKQVDETYIDFDVEHYYQYYIGFYFPSAYLLFRRFISLSHLFSQFLLRHLNGSNGIKRMLET